LFEVVMYKITTCPRMANLAPGVRRALISLTTL
jgi:hypothetical protein